MNERIIELRKDAYKLVQTDLQTNERDEVVDNREHLKMVFDKFAELIVKECADRVAGSVVRDKGHVPQDPHSRGWNDAVAYAGRELKRYFGVE